MAHIVFAWELGSNYGHIARMYFVSELLLASGHSIDFIVPDIKRLKDFGPTLVAEKVKAYPAPRARKKVGKLSRNPDNFSEILLSFHYYETNLLRNVIHDWRKLFKQLKPDLICFESAPTAILAARGVDVKTANISSFYFTPPDHYPMPSFTYNKSISTETLKKSDDFLLHNIQNALDDFSESSIYAYFETDANILAAVPELDFYEPYRSSKTRYYASLISGNFGCRSLNWSSNTYRKKVFAYLSVSYPCLKLFLRELNTQDLEARIFISGMTQEGIDEQFSAFLKKDYFELSAEPYIIDDSLSEAELIICHSGGTIMHSVSYGKPLLNIPLQREQMMTAQCCIRAGIGLGLNPHESNLGKIKDAITQGLNNKQLEDSALKLKNKYSLSNAKQAQRIVADELESLLCV